MATEQSLDGTSVTAVDVTIKKVRLYVEMAAITVLFLLVWEGYVRVFDVSAAVLPAPSRVVDVFVSNYPLFLEHTFISFRAIIAGFVVGTLLGFVCGLSVFYSSFVRIVFYPFLTMIAIIPKIAFAPLLVIWFGSGLFSKVTLAALVVFFPMLVNTYSGFKDIDDELLLMSDLYDTSELFTFAKIRLPNASPYLITGVKLGLIFSLIGTIVAEYIAGNSGIGYLIIDFSGKAQTPQAFGAMLSIIILSVVLYGVALLFEKRALHWHQS